MTEKASKQRQYFHKYTTSKGFILEIVDSDINLQSFEYYGTIDAAYQWSYAGSIVANDPQDIKTLQKLPKFTIKITRPENISPNGKVYVSRAIDCYIVNTNTGEISISRVIQWRPKVRDDAEPFWKFEPKTIFKY